MPVIGHDIAGVIRFYMMKFKWKFISSPQAVFVVVQIMQKNLLLIWFLLKNHIYSQKSEYCTTFCHYNTSNYHLAIVYYEV